MDLKELEKIYTRASKAYAEGSPIMSDPEFDELERKLIEMGSELVNLVSEDFLSDDLVDANEVSYESFSIKSVDSWEGLRAYFQMFPNATFAATLKLDGICTKLGVSPATMTAQSRNRASREALDFTKAIELAVGKPNVDSPTNITGESYVPWECLDYFREKYDANKYISPRSAALSLLRAPHMHDAEDLKLLQFRAFHTDVAAGTFCEKLAWLESIGLKTPKCVTFTVDITKDIEQQLTPILEEVDTGEPSDGVVICVNDNLDLGASKFEGKYMTTQIAVKLGKWGGKAYEAVVTGINFGKAKGAKGVTLLIEPFRLEDNNTITKVNAYNMGIIERNKIKKGSVIKFVRVSNNMCNLVYE